MTNDQLERLESLKAGSIGAATLALAFVVTTFVNGFFFPSAFNFSSWFAGAIAVVCGFLFGVTYRYIIRENSNIQLKTGAVMAFGCVRGLTQIEMALQSSQTVLRAIATAGESIIWFALAAIALSLSLRFGWVKAFSSN